MKGLRQILIVSRTVKITNEWILEKVPYLSALEVCSRRGAIQDPRLPLPLK